jgi:hypothetical protein
VFFEPVCCLRPVNIIQVTVLTEFEYGNFAKVIGAGFDLMHCRIALKVNPNLSFHYEADAETMECLKQRKLILLPGSFHEGSAGKAVELQLWRIMKYGRRNFQW